jgi:type I restriction enzyme S subunit
MTELKNLITGNIDVWTSAIKKRSSTGRGSNKKIELTGIKKLRELILELAVRGKLVPQEPNDEPASELLKLIVDEKDLLIKDKKIKKQKQLPDIVKDEQPFDLPNSWEWFRLGDLTNYGVCDKAESDNVDETTWVLELEDVEKNTSKLLKRTRFKDRQFKSSKNRFQKGDVIYGKLRPYLDKVLVADEPGVCTTEMIPIRAYNSVSPNFLRLSLKAPYFINYANNSTHGMNLPRMGTDKARLALIPIVPINEQYRIVTKVDELMALCDQLEQQTEQSISAHQTLVQVLLDTLTASADAQEYNQNWTRIAEFFDTLFITEDSIEQLKQTILQLAVMGKLVSQDTNNEPASELLKKIAVEKAQLIAEKKITKQKPLPEISEADRPFILPIGWSWSRLGNIYDLQYGNNLPKDKRSETGEYPVYGSNGVVGSHNECCIPDPCIVIGRKGSAGALNLCSSEGCWVTDVAYSVTPSQYLDIDFVFKSLHTFGLGSLGKGIKPGLNRNEAYNVVIAIPPFEEQKRIAAKTKELFELCEQIRNQISNNQMVKVKLAETFVKQSLSH